MWDDLLGARTLFTLVIIQKCNSLAVFSCHVNIIWPSPMHPCRETQANQNQQGGGALAIPYKTVFRTHRLFMVPIFLAKKWAVFEKTPWRGSCLLQHKIHTRMHTKGQCGRSGVYPSIYLFIQSSVINITHPIRASGNWSRSRVSERRGQPWSNQQSIGGLTQRRTTVHTRTCAI